MAEISIGTKQAQQALNELVTKFRELKTTLGGIEQGAAGFRKLSTALNDLKKSHRDITGAVVTLKKELANTTKSQKNYLTQTRNLKAVVQQLTSANKALSDSLKSANTRLKDATQSTKKQAEANKGLGVTFKNILTSMTAFFGIRMFFQAIKDTFELTKKLDSLNFALLAVTKTQESAAQNQDFLLRITKAYGAEIVSTTERYIRFLAAAEQSNVALEDTQQIFETMTKVSGVLGFNTTDLTGIFLALEQMLSKGKVTTEELRRQLGERLPGAMGIMATSLGVTIPQLDVMLKKGEVLSAEVLPEFARQVELSFGISNVTKVETLTAAWARMKNKWVEIFREFANGSGLAKTLANGIDFLASSFSDIINNVVLATKAWIAYKVAVILSATYTALMAKRTTYLKLQQIALTFEIKAATFAWLRFNAVLKANWIGIVVTLITGLIYLFDRFNVSLEENTKAVIASSKEFIELQHKGKQIADSINKMADAYDELSVKVDANNREQQSLTDSIDKNERAQTKLKNKIKLTGDASGVLTEELRILNNEHVDLVDKTQKFSDEQKELERTTKALAQAFPDAVTAENEWGDATKLNTEKIRELNVELGKTALLRASSNIDEQTSLVTDLTNAQTKLNKEVKDYKEVYDALLKTNPNSTATADTKEQLLLARERADENRKNIILTEQQLIANKKLIYSYSEEGIAAKAEDDRKAAEAAQDVANAKTKADGLRNVKNLSEEINNLTAERELLAFSETEKVVDGEKITTKTHKTRIGEINAEIIAKQKQIDLIEGKKDKGGSPSKKDKIDTSEIDLRISVSKRLIEIQNAIVADEKNSYAIRKQALEDASAEEFILMELNYDKEIKLAENNKGKLAIINQENSYDRIRLAEATQLKLEALLNEEVVRLTASVSETQLSIENERNTALLEAREKYVNDSAKLREAELAINEQFDRKIIEAQIAMVKETINTFKELGVSTDVLDALLLKLNVSLGNVGKGKGDEVKKNLDQILGFAQDFAKEIGNIANNIFAGNIENINAEIEAQDEKFDRMIALSEGDEQKQKNLAIEKEANRKVLEKKRLKEEQKQAKANKAFALADIAMNTARAIIAVWANGKDPTGISQGLQTAFVSILGAAQLASVLATPIPKYKDGGEITEAHVGMINDGGKKEYIERGGELYASNTKNALVGLMPGDVIHKDFDSMKNNSNFIKGYDDVSERDIMMFTAYNKSQVLQQRNLDKMLIGIEKSIDKGFKKVKINNTIKNQMINDYGQSLSRWN